MSVAASPRVEKVLVEQSLFGGSAVARLCVVNWRHSHEKDKLHSTSAELVRCQAAEQGIKTVLFPFSDFSGNICHAHTLPKRHNYPDCIIATGTRADGAFIPNGQSFAFGAVIADCLLTVFWGQKTGHLIAAHAGRESFYSRAAVKRCYLDKVDSEVKPSGIVHNAIRRLKDLSNPADQIFVWSGFGIGPENFIHSPQHPQYGQSNAALHKCFSTLYGKDGGFIRYGGQAEGLDLRLVCRLQSESEGVPSRNISQDNINTFADESYASRSGNPSSPRRNLVFVSRC